METCNWLPSTDVAGAPSGRVSSPTRATLLLGYWDKGKLRYASHVGSGFDGKTLAQVKARLDGLQRKTCPFADKLELNGPAIWVAKVRRECSAFVVLGVSVLAGVRSGLH